MSFVSLRGWDIPGVGRAILGLRGKSILRKRQTEVKVKRSSGHETSFIAVGRLGTSAHETDESLLHRIAEAILPSRTEKSDHRIARHGKGQFMGNPVSYTENDLAHLPRQAIDYVDELECRSQKRQSRKKKAGNPSAYGAVVSVESKHGEIVEFDH